MKKDIKERFDAIRTNQNPPFYKTTEAGVLPEDWDTATLSAIADEITETAGTDSYETVSISAGIGFVNQAQKFGKELSGKQYEKYTVLHRGDFSYNKGNSNKYPQGCIYRLSDRETAAVPNVFESFRIKLGCADYYEHLFTSGFLNRQLSRKINHGVRDDGLLNLTGKDFYSCVLPVPPMEEQKRIAEILTACDKVIELKENLIAQTKQRKKYLMQKLFHPTDKARLTGFEKESRKECLLGEVCTILRGGSPRPIEKYLTDSPSGLNWIKIGDTAQEGKYITKTQQRILPSGLKKTRQVFPGDFILSNSMSFGRPYIVKIDGCVHDGWLIIKDYQDSFTTDYLYYLLSSDYIYAQYRQLAAGSSVHNLNVELVGGVSVFIPTIAEQTAIANVLSALDTQIEALQNELSERKKQRNAITGLLLTGIVRTNHGGNYAKPSDIQ